MNTADALEKVRKLLRMTEARGCTEAEARQAASMAQRIMLAHRIESLDLAGPEAAPAPDRPVSIWDEPLDSHKTRAAWRGRLASEIARNTGCTVFWDGGALKIVGTADNATSARYLYAFASREIDRMARRHTGNGRTWMNNWRIGAASGFGESLREANEAARREASPTGTALVLVDRAIAVIRAEERRADAFMRSNLRLSHSARSSGRHDSEAREAGKRDGRTINAGGNRPALGGGRLMLK